MFGNVMFLSTSGGKTLVADLLKNGVNCEVRKLHVGDFAWVARERVPGNPGEICQGQRVDNSG